MMKVRTGRDETHIVVSSAAGRDIGLFLVFLAAVGTWPIQYIYQATYTPHFITVRDWTPSAHASLLMGLFGLLFIFNTRKHIWVKGRALIMRDGFWRKALHFTAKDPCSIKLRAIETELRHRAFEVWQIKLVTEGYEYLLDARPNQQLVSRRLAEALTRALGCTLLELEDKVEIIIPATDLDLPFCERVKRYPLVLGSPQPRPATGHINLEDRGSMRIYSWGLWATGLLLEIVALVLIALFMSWVHWNGVSILDLAAATNNYTYYYALLGLLFISLVILPGYHEQLIVEHDHVRWQIVIWRIPVEAKTIPVDNVEEIRQHEGMRGPVVQVISARKIISVRVNDRIQARWLAYDIGSFISGRNVAAGDEAQARA
ncbi:MAG TPA: hypothetical protein VGO93_04915 [Candidatus Xenobia bacterium]|jgi:hypothetical protein